jgi:ubiquinone/menaquinone biosynthesis C-methylase UbiE
MIKSKGWNWNIVKEDFAQVWKNPSIESYYLVNRWSTLGERNFLDLGCGLGRHSVLFAKNNFNVSCFDISEDAVNRTKKWCMEENLTCDYKVGDMLNLPYEDNSFDCIYCRNVVSHTDTSGMKVIVNELKRVLKKGGECYLTLCSKDSWGFRQESWPIKDENTKLRNEEGPEYMIPHFFVDYNLCMELFKDFEMVKIFKTTNYYQRETEVVDSSHFHLLIKKR